MRTSPRDRLEAEDSSTDVFGWGPDMLWLKEEALRERQQSESDAPTTSHGQETATSRGEEAATTPTTSLHGHEGGSSFGTPMLSVLQSAVGTPEQEGHQLSPPLDASGGTAISIAAALMPGAPISLASSLIPTWDEGLPRTPTKSTPPNVEALQQTALNWAAEARMLASAHSDVLPVWLTLAQASGMPSQDFSTAGSYGGGFDDVWSAGQSAFMGGSCSGTASSAAAGDFFPWWAAGAWDMTPPPQELAVAEAGQQPAAAQPAAAYPCSHTAGNQEGTQSGHRI
eukprot:TRINITY_DN7514_c0_g1_i1.p1 TRINITY_DN7514_c0_g1~~TRINITY_DN7514_c0_g1_i1.p1  ORF type:complete len:284 (-),score=75.22 TRINITY_DN7514_c0_g1_i1:258-1109(-)